MTFRSALETGLTHEGPRKHAGFSLVEAMVALVVLSVGMIGMAALHGQGLSASRTAVYRTKAVNLTADLADRIRANRFGEAAYAGAGADKDCTPQGAAAAVDCTPAEMAQHDVLLWNDRVGRVLPDGQGEVEFNATTEPPTYTITVQWDEIAQGQVEHAIEIQVPNT